MQFKISQEPLEKIKVDLIVLGCPQKETAFIPKSGGGQALDKILGGLLSDTIEKEHFKGEVGAYKMIHTTGKIPSRGVLLVGMGKLDEFTLDVPRKIGAKVAEVANEIHSSSVAGVILPETIKGFSSFARIEAFVAGILLGCYKFQDYKSEKDIEPVTLKEVVLLVKGNKEKTKVAINRAVIISDGVNLVRQLVNTPAKDLTPDILSKKAKEVALTCKLKCEIFGPKEILAQKMNLILAVSRGSENEPRFVHMSYKPSGKIKSRVAIVGKGVTFDSGGYDLKPPRSMLDMKHDMAGSAVCIAVMKIISKLKPNVAVDAYMPIVDNMIDSKAEVPGNIIKSRNGKTVEIISTDAEGRLILADAISYAIEKKPDYLIDVATLTGGLLYALGELYTAVIGNNQKLIDKYLTAANYESEPAWQLPLAKEYKKGFKEGPADLRNMGKTRADTIAASLFLEEFVGETKWLHLDIAESAWTDEPLDYSPKGGTGAVVRTLTKLLTSM